MPWPLFWDRFGRPILDAIVFAQKKGIAHRDIKPKNVLVTENGQPKLADYGIAKLLERSSQWKPVRGFTFRFDYTPGYTPSKPEDEQYALTRDCFAFAAIAVSCVAGRIIEQESDLKVILAEASLPSSIRVVLERCLSENASNRPPLASVLKEQLEQIEADTLKSARGAVSMHFVLSGPARTSLERRFEGANQADIERFFVSELFEICAIIDKSDTISEGLPHIEIVGTTWKFDGTIAGRYKEIIHITRASEIGAGLASSLREMGTERAINAQFHRPLDAERSGQELRLLIAEAKSAHREYVHEREARATQRIFRVWRSYLRDRADLESRRGNAIRYIDRQVVNESVVFTTEIAQDEGLIGQDRVIQVANGRVGGIVSLVSFNHLMLDVEFGDPSLLPARGEIAINTIAAQKALAHQAQALDALVFDRTASPRLKQIILDPRVATPTIPISGLVPVDDKLDHEKVVVLERAIGVQDVLAIEGPPGTGKTKLITEIVVQWLKRNPQSRILLSSQTHIALDNVLQRVAELVPTVRLVRIGRPDDQKISEHSKKLLLENRVEQWISDVRKASDSEMTRWAEENGIDRKTIAIGMKVERLLQILRRQHDVQEEILSETQEDESIQLAGMSSGEVTDTEETEEETTQLESRVGMLRRGLRALVDEERKIRGILANMGGYAEELASSSDKDELIEWALHFLNESPCAKICRDRLALLEDWHLRVGRSPDFNAAVLSSAQIIAGTCVGIASVKGMEQVTYDLCIVDEASKATPTEILIPMVRSLRWIIVGDTKQLPPFFEELSDELLQDFDDREVKSTMLDRFVSEHDGLPLRCRSELKNQYRMIKPIGDLVSACFYQGRLNSPVVTHGLKLAPVFSRPITWVSSHKLSDRFERIDGQTFQNTLEVRIVRQLLQRLQFVAKATKSRISVAVIAGYTGQVRLLRDMASQGIGEWQDLDVQCNTVDAFQGREADVCLYSVVRSNSRGDLGFLKEQPRLNVALSRGKSGLVIVGDQVFCRVAGGRNPFRSVIDYIDREDETCALESWSDT